jgi:MYXO-CTERM domain-containing protein
VLDAAVNLYVTDAGNNTIRMVTAAGVVTTFAGTAKKTGDADGVGTAALFNNPTGMAMDVSANLYVADTFNQTIRKISTAALTIYDTDGTTVLRTIPAGTSTTLAGSSGISGTFDGTGMFALFNSPSDVTLDAANNVYVADTGNSCIRRITSAGVVTTVAGMTGISGNRDGAGSSALFNQPQALKFGSFIYVLDTGNSIVRAILPSTFGVSTVPLKAATTTTTTTTTTSSSSGGGGGAPSAWFLAALGLLAAGRRFFRRQGAAG